MYASVCCCIINDILCYFFCGFSRSKILTRLLILSPTNFRLALAPRAIVLTVFIFHYIFQLSNEGRLERDLIFVDIVKAEGKCASCSEYSNFWPPQPLISTLLPSRFQLFGAVWNIQILPLTSFSYLPPPRSYF